MAPSSPADEEWSDSDQIMSDSSQVMSDPVEPQLPTQLNLPAVEDGSSILTIALGSDTGSIFQPTPTSGTCHTDEYSPITAADKADLVIDQAQLDVDYARKILDGLPIEQGGWCELVTHQPTKRGGYIQVSYGGANKFASLQEVVLWADGKVLLSRGDQCSHRCHSPRSELLATSFQSRPLRIMPGKVAWCGSNVTIATSISLFACMIRAASRLSQASKPWRTFLPMVCVAFFWKRHDSRLMTMR